MVFQNLHFSIKKKTYLNLYLLSRYITLNLALFYQTYYNSSFNPGFLVTNLRKKHEF